MKHRFYDVTAKGWVEAEVTSKTTYGPGKRQRHAFKGNAPCGRTLTVLVSKDIWDKCDAPYFDSKAVKQAFDWNR